jgi:tRNA(Phe) wybutosine-synthesizing methylase Tyw3
MVQSPIVHVRCRDIESGAGLRALGEACGLKHSTLRTLTMDNDGTVENIVVELLGTGSMDMPLGTGERIFPDPEYLDFLVGMANMVFTRNRERFHRLLARLKQDPSLP